MENKETRLVWITMLAAKNKDQIVISSVPGLAKRAGVTLEECEHALERLSSPDKYSQSKEDDGRRIRQIDGGWFIVNGELHAGRLNEDERREYQRTKQKEYRRRKKEQESQKTGPLPGEKEYNDAINRGASQEELNAILDKYSRDSSGATEEAT